MEYLLYLLVGLVPSLALIIMAYFFLKKSQEKEYSRALIEIKGERQKFFLEPRADAYQRLVLLLERINPNSLIMRLNPANKNATLFQTELLNNIRTEFDHNVAQQIFIAEPTWDMVKKSKEETIRIINISAQSLQADATAFDLANKIFETTSELTELPTEIAIKALKKEFQALF